MTDGHISLYIPSYYLQIHSSDMRNFISLARTYSFALALGPDTIDKKIGMSPVEGVTEAQMMAAHMCISFIIILYIWCVWLSFVWFLCSVRLVFVCGK